MIHPREEVLALLAGDDLSSTYLPWTSAWQTRRHVANCDECRATVEAYAQMRVEISALPTPEPPASLNSTILARVLNGEATRAKSTQRAPWLAWAAAATVAAAAIALVTLTPTTPGVDAPPALRAMSRATSRTNVAPPTGSLKPTASATAIEQTGAEPTGTAGSAVPAGSAAAAGGAAAASVPATLSPKFVTVDEAEKDRDTRFMAAAKPAEIDRWATNAPAQSRHAAQVLVGPRAELLRNHALPGRVEIVALPGSPVQIVSAEALFAEGHLIDPSVEIRNTGTHPIKDCQLIWIVRDASGNEFRGTIVAASKPLAPGARAKYAQSIVLQPERKGADARRDETDLAAARIFVRSAATSESVWVPERTALEAQNLGGFIPLPSATMQALAEYHNKAAKAAAKLQ